MNESNEQDLVLPPSDGRFTFSFLDFIFSHLETDIILSFPPVLKFPDFMPQTSHQHPRDLGVNIGLSGYCVLET